MTLKYPIPSNNDTHCILLPQKKHTNLLTKLGTFFTITESCLYKLAIEDEAPDDQCCKKTYETSVTELLLLTFRKIDTNIGC